MKTISRRVFMDKTAKASAAVIVTSKLPFTGINNNPGKNERMVGIQIGAASFYDEGVSQVLDNVTGMAGVNTIFIPVFAYNRGLAGRQMPGEPFPDHGVQKEDTNFVGGYYAKMHEEYYKNTVYKPEFARAPELGDYDVLAEVIPEAKRRNIKVIAFMADNFGTNRPHYEKLCEVDINGKSTGNVNLVNPQYRGLLFGLIEDCLRSYDVDGLLWRTERMGPISNVLEFTHSSTAPPSSFDEYTFKRARKKGIDIDQAVKGYRSLEEFAQNCKAGHTPADGRYVTFWRICLKYPEILAWEMLWVDALRETYKEVYEFAKSIRSDVLVGSALSFKGIYDPFYRARQDLKELSNYADFLKIVMYDKVGGSRMHTFLERSGNTLYGDMDTQHRFDFVNSIMGYEDHKFEDLTHGGLPVSMVERETRRALEGASGTKMKIWPSIDIDIPVKSWAKVAPDYAPCTPDSVKESVKAVFRGGAGGIILARKYSEMNLSNLRGVGEALKEL